MVWKITQTFFLLAGVVILGLGLGADILFEGRPGFSSMQLVATFAGCCLIAVSLVLRSRRIQEWLSHTLRQDIGLKLGVSAIAIIASLIIIEIGLALMGYTPDFSGSAEADAARLQPAPWWFCDELGCRYNWEIVQAECATEEAPETKHVCNINTQGFYDQDEFVSSESLTNADYKILLLGDSFTWGYSADIGQSWAEVLDQNVNAEGDIVIWNAGIAGTGTNQAYALLEHYQPILEPDLVILGFSTNDFNDSVHPLDSQMHLLSGERILRKYKLDDNLNIVEMSSTELAYRAHHIRPPSNSFEYTVRSTRIGSIFMNGMDSLVYALEEVGFVNKSQDPYESVEFWNMKVQITEDYLTLVRDYSDDHNVEFLILLIPHRDLDRVGAVSREYQAARHIFGGLSIPYIDPLSVLDFAVDYDNRAGKHWDNDGHAKIGQIVSDCVFEIMDGTPPAECHSLVVGATNSE